MTNPIFGADVPPSSIQNLTDQQYKNGFDPCDGVNHISMDERGLNAAHRAATVFKQIGAGSVERDWEDKARESVSVDDFYDPNVDAGDYTAAFAKAIAKLRPTGGTIYVSPGIRDVSGQIDLSDSVAIRIAGFGGPTGGASRGSVIRFTGAPNGPLIDARSNAGFGIRGCYLWQQHPTYTGNLIDVSHSTAAADSAHGLIESNIFFMQSPNAIGIDVSKSIIQTIRENYFAGGEYAILAREGLDFYANVINVLGNTYRYQENQPIFIGGRGTQSWNIIGNTFEPTAAGHAAAVRSISSGNIVFEGNWCGDADKIGEWLVFEGTSGLSIRNNFISAGAYGIIFQGTAGINAVHITGNTFSGIGAPSTVNSDVFIEGGTNVFGDCYGNFHYDSVNRINGIFQFGRVQSNPQSYNYFSNPVVFQRGGVWLNDAVANSFANPCLVSVKSNYGGETLIGLQASPGHAANLVEIKDSANVLLQRTKPNGALETSILDNGFYAADFGNRGGISPYGVRAFYPNISDGTGQFFFVGQDSGAVRFQVLGNGNVQNVTGVYGAISDAKLKENIEDCSPKLDKIMRLSVRNYSLKSEPGSKYIGFIAQELEKVFPSLIEEAPDFEIVKKTREIAIPETIGENGEVVPAKEIVEEYEESIPTGASTKSVKYSVLIPILVKAIQELKSELDELKVKAGA